MKFSPARAGEFLFAENFQKKTSKTGKKICNGSPRVTILFRLALVT